MKKIALALKLSEKTVEFHKHHIMEAFNLKSNADLVLFALKKGLISVNSEALSCSHPRDFPSGAEPRNTLEIVVSFEFTSALRDDGASLCSDGGEL